MIRMLSMAIVHSPARFSIRISATGLPTGWTASKELMILPLPVSSTHEDNAGLLRSGWSASVGGARSLCESLQRQRRRCCRRDAVVGCLFEGVGEFDDLGLSVGTTVEGNANRKVAARGEARWNVHRGGVDEEGVQRGDAQLVVVRRIQAVP